MLSKTKIDDIFPKGQFLIKGCGDPFRIDTNINGGEILFFVREDVPAKLLFVETLPIKFSFIEINLWKKKKKEKGSFPVPITYIEIIFKIIFK